VKQMLSALKKTEGDELYKLRTKIAERIRVICESVLVAPAGSGPQLQKKIVKSKLADTGSSPLHRAQLAKRLDDTRSKKRFFAIKFRNETARIVYPNDANSTAFDEHLYGDERGLSFVEKDGSHELIIPLTGGFSFENIPLFKK
jgi:hypothetical protein